MELDLSNYSLPVFEALASKTRLNILRYIGNRQKSIGEIASHLKISNAITTRHVQQMEDAGLLDSVRGTGEKRNKKLVFLKVDNIHILFPEKVYHKLLLHSTELKLGHFTDFQVLPTCGIATTDEVVGKVDEPKFFMDSRRVDAALLWFSEGYVEYKIPNLLQENEQPKLLEITLELASEFPLSQNVWPSDISIYINNKKVALYTSPGNFSDTRGRYTPPWWNDCYSQYGQLKHIRVNAMDTGIDGESYSQITIEDLNLHHSPFITLRFAVEADAENKGGLTLFGKGFGNYDQNILINLYYSPSE
ncbi:helix-turn-helix domain-containing protein [Lachnospiraceae bacterium OttesenSCG-928-D06]|nr:helix-turn-helix domain-containing protein [Lachnospiraceae bacterium OttesenSCG-928-D06]